MAKNEIKGIQLNILYKNNTWLNNNNITTRETILKEITITIFGIVGLNLEIPDKGIKDLVDNIRSKYGREFKTIESPKVNIVDCVGKTTYNIKIENEDEEYALRTHHELGNKGDVLPNLYIIGFSIGNDSENRPIIRPIIIAQKIVDEKPARIPVGVPGLAELLFPDPEDRGFKRPIEDNVVPRVVIVKGMVGTGKTTLATQMMVQMAKTGFSCKYLCSNEEAKAIKQTATSFRFCKDSELEELPIQIEQIGNDFETHFAKGGPKDKHKHSFLKLLTEWMLNDSGKALNNTDVLFLDSLNLAQAGKPNRQELWNIFKKYKEKKNLLSIFLLEDYGADGTGQVRQMISDCEFLADVVIEMGEQIREGYQTKSIKVKKKHYGKQVYGSHFYKICPFGSSVPCIGGTGRGVNVYAETGIVVYPSIHRYLSRARASVKKSYYVNTGVTHLDAILLGGSIKEPKPQIETGCISSDSCVVISGARGGHKLPLGLNILMGGMWKVNRSKTNLSVVADEDVLMILLDEEADIQIKAAATAINTHMFTNIDIPEELGTLDNGKYIWWMPREKIKHARSGKCPHYMLHEEEDANRGKKVQFHSYCAEIGAEETTEKECRKLMVAGFRPGCITPEEFIYIVDRLLTPSGPRGKRFGRVLFLSTAHLQNRFPLLGRTELFIPALVDLFKSKNVVSIFVDVQGHGSDKKQSYGLASLADYIIGVDEFARENPYNIVYSDKLKSEEKKDYSQRLQKQSQRYITSLIHVENVRGKEYSRPCHAVMVRPTKDGKGNELFILNAREVKEPPLNFL
ncbi:MAG: RAD55 family ATPase [Planctomycetota bacterium]|jgi:KaiC/GvpD/RAD55 family RecA-like ATPase